MDAFNTQSYSMESLTRGKFNSNHERAVKAIWLHQAQNVTKSLQTHTEFQSGCQIESRMKTVADTSSRNIVARKNVDVFHRELKI